MPPPTSSTSQLHYFKTELPAPFSGDGTEDFTLWCRRLEVAINASPNEHKPQLAALLPAKLSGKAFTLWDSLSDDIKADYDRVKSALSSVFVQHQSIHRFQTCINARPRFPHEPLEVFAAEIARLCQEAFPKYGKVAQNSERFRRFVAGLAPYLQLKIHEQGIKTLEDAVTYAVQLERAQEASQSSIFPSSSTVPIPPPPTPTPTPFTLSSSTTPTSSVNSIVDTTLVQLMHKLDSRLDDIHYELRRARSPRRSAYSYRPHSPSPSRDYSYRRSNSPYPRPRDYDPREARDYRDSRPRPTSRDTRDYRDTRPRSESRDRYNRRDSRERYDQPSKSADSSRVRSPSRRSVRDTSRRSPSPGGRRVTFTHDAQPTTTNQGN